MNIVLCLYFCLSLLHHCNVKAEVPSTCQKNGASTNQLQSIFIGNCNAFVNVVQQTNCDVQSMNVNCNDLWIQFSRVILNKNLCQLTQDDFQPLMANTNYPMKPDKSMFWSGTYHMAHHSKYLFRQLFEWVLFIYISNDFSLESSWINHSGRHSNWVHSQRLTILLGSQSKRFRHANSLSEMSEQRVLGRRVG